MSKLARLTSATIMFVLLTPALAVGFYGLWNLLWIAFEGNPFHGLPSFYIITFRIIICLWAGFWVVVAIWVYSAVGEILYDRPRLVECPPQADNDGKD